MGRRREREGEERGEGENNQEQASSSPLIGCRMCTDGSTHKV